MKFVVVYDSNSEYIADFVGENFHIKHNIEYFDVNHPKEKKSAIMYKTYAGAKQNPFIGLYSDEDEIMDALWSEKEQITRELIKTFFKKYE